MRITPTSSANVTERLLRIPRQQLQMAGRVREYLTTFLLHNLTFVIADEVQEFWMKYLGFF